MELIRNRLFNIGEFLETQRGELSHYLRTFPDSPPKTLQVASSLIENLNQTIVLIASSISQSCKPLAPSDTTDSAIRYSPQEVRQMCKVKAKLQEIRFSFLGASSQRRVQIAQIQRIYEEAVELCPNEIVYTEFKGATKGRDFGIDGVEEIIQVEKEEREGEVSREKKEAMEEKKMMYMEVSNHLHAEQRKKRTQSPYQPKRPVKAIYRQSETVPSRQSRREIFTGMKKQDAPRRRKFNYLQAFQREERRLENHRYILSNSSRIKNGITSTSTQQSPKTYDKGVNTNEQEGTVQVSSFCLLQNDSQKSKQSSNSNSQPHLFPLAAQQQIQDHCFPSPAPHIY